jgi:glycosyltransferase involved in cell wall biosynthesis
MPISILEALASGVPVVSTAVGGVPFIVEHGSTALLVPPRDAEAMARAVLDILSDRTLAARLANQGRESVQQYSWQNVRAHWIRIYREIALSSPESAAPEVN